MLKKLSAVILATVMTISLGVNTFAYSNMYTSNSGIPDFSEAEGGEFVLKSYEAGSTKYLYTIPENSNVGWLYSYLKLLKDNGYEVVATNYFPFGSEYIHLGLVNHNKGLYMFMFLTEYGVTLDIGDTKNFA